MACCRQQVLNPTASLVNFTLFFSFQLFLQVMGQVSNMNASDSCFVLVIMEWQNTVPKNPAKLSYSYRIYSCTSRIFLDVKMGSKKSTSTYIWENMRHTY